MIDISDEFILFLRSATAGYLNIGSLHLMDFATREMPPGGAIVEIGSMCGLSLSAIHYYAHKNGRAETIFACDPWERDLKAKIAGSDIYKQEYRVLIFDTFRRHLAFFCRPSPPHAVEARANVFFDRWRDKVTVIDVFGRLTTLGGPLSFAHIDGSHLYDDVQADFINCDTCLLPGGFLLFDDSGDDMGWTDIQRVVKEALATGRYEIAAVNANYLLRKLT